VNSRTSHRFWEAFARLPADVQAQARKNFRIWQRDPFHPALHFKEVKPDLWSVRVTLQYRALGIRRDEEIRWFWIGSHADYDRLIR